MGHRQDALFEILSRFWRDVLKEVTDCDRGFAQIIAADFASLNRHRVIGQRHQNDLVFLSCHRQGQNDNRDKRNEQQDKGDVSLSANRAELNKGVIGRHVRHPAKMRSWDGGIAFQRITVSGRIQ